MCRPKGRRYVQHPFSAGLLVPGFIVRLSYYEIGVESG
jgi:hypothetical protein